MLRARLPLAVVLAATTLLVPATAALAADGGQPSDPTGVTQEVTGSGTEQGAGDQNPTVQDDSGSTTPGSSSGDANPDASPSEGSSELPDLSTQEDPPENPLAPLLEELEGMQDSGGSEQPDLAGALEGLAGCLETAGSAAKPFEEGQKCFEAFIGELTNDPRSDCFSENDFTLQFLLDRLESGQPPSEADLMQFEENLTGLIECLSASEEPPPAPSGGGGGEAPTQEPTSNEAPAAVAVSGTPDFTG